MGLDYIHSLWPDESYKIVRNGIASYTYPYSRFADLYTAHFQLGDVDSQLKLDWEREHSDSQANVLKWDATCFVLFS